MFTSRIRIFLLFALVQWANTESSDEDLGYRLPEDIVPISYELKIIPNLKDNFDFSGEVTINVKATKNTKEVWLHCYGLNLTAISISNETEKISQDGHELIPAKQFLKLTTKSELFKNCEYSIHALFRGSLNDEPIGFYKERYRRGNGDIKWLATTQLEPIYARTVFPCFDEPHFKTPFSLQIARSENQMSVTNMPYIMSKGPELKIQNRTWDMFESKLSISTFQVAFTVTEYFFKPDVDDGVLLGTPNRGSKSILQVLSKSKAIFKELESYTNKSFAKESMHMVAISDFLVGALENIGLSTIKESLIIHSQSKTSKLSKEVTEMAAVHEFAHQWFGEDVTPLWWNYTWLKEGFATFMEYKILNSLEPKWKMEDLFITDILQQALLQDKFTHPMTNQVQTPSEIINMYDFVTYQKGASILKMLEHIITPSTFKKGVRRYLKIGSNKTIVTPDDLWDALQEQAIEDKIKKLPPTTIKELMKSWTEQPGYPLITVIVDHKDVIIKQEPYTKYSSNATWLVPITYGTASDDLTETTPMEWLSPYEHLVLDNAVEKGQWIIVNLGQAGYYRVNYDYDNWKALTNQLIEDHKAIDPKLRAKLIDDALNLALDQRLNYGTAVKLLQYFPQEKHYLPQISVLYNLKNLFSLFEQTSIESSLKLFIEQLIGKLFNQLGASNGFFDNHITHRIRKDVVYLACKIGIKKCQRSTSSLFYKHYKRLEKIDENLKPAVFCTAIETLREDFVFENLLKFYNKTNSILDREIIINSFSCLKNPVIIKRILSRNITVLRKRDLENANNIVLHSGKSTLAVTEYIRIVLAGINGNVIPPRIESNLKYIIRNMKIVNITQLRALNALLYEVKELERFHSILNELVDRSQNVTVSIRDTERAARDINETINDIFSETNKAKKFDYLFHPIEYFHNKYKDSHKISDGIVKIVTIKNNVENYIGDKIKNVFMHFKKQNYTPVTSEVSTTEKDVSTFPVINSNSESTTSVGVGESRTEAVPSPSPNTE